MEDEALEVHDGQTISLEAFEADVQLIADVYAALQEAGHAPTVENLFAVVSKLSEG